MVLPFNHAGIVVILAIIAAWIFSSIRTYRRLSHIPGPRWAAWSRWWILRIQWTGRGFVFLKAVNDEYGPLARIGPKELLTSDAEFVRRMNAANSRYNRSITYNANRLVPRVDNIISLTDRKAHEDLKRKMLPGYTRKENALLEQTIDEQMQELVDLIHRQYCPSKDPRGMDLARVIPYFAMDAISALAFGESFGNMAANEDKYGIMQATTEAMPIAASCSTVPEVFMALEKMRILDYLVPKKGCPTGFGKLYSLGEEIVAKRYGPDKVVNQDMLGSWINHGVTQAEATTAAVINIVAGSDTISTSLRFLFLHLCTTPRILNRLLAEIDGAVAICSISTPASDAELRRLPYLQACIKECLRLWPPIVFHGAKEVPPEGDTWNGMYIPGETRIRVNITSILHNVKTFGADACLFRPERWLEAPPEQLIEMERDVNLVFGYGRSVSMGKSIWYIEQGKVVFELLRRFDFTFSFPANPIKYQEWTHFAIQDMWVRVTPREKKVQNGGLNGSAAFDWKMNG